MAAFFDGKAKERGNGEARQSHQQAAASSIWQVCSAEHQVNRMRCQYLTGCSHIHGEITSEFPTVQPFRQGLSVLEILSDHEDVPSGECHLAPPKYSAVTGGCTTYQKDSK